MAKMIQEYLPVKYKHFTMLGMRVPTEIMEEVKAIMKVEKLSWSEVITACLRQFLDEKKGYRKPID